jgi:hypothetical protein
MGNGIKKRKRLKKMKKKNLTWVGHKKQEIQDKMNVYVNGPSGFSKEFNNLWEKNI